MLFQGIKKSFLWPLPKHLPNLQTPPPPPRPGADVWANFQHLASLLQLYCCRPALLTLAIAAIDSSLYYYRLLGAFLHTRISYHDKVVPYVIGIGRV